MTDFGHGMKALSELRVIQNEIGVMCFSIFEDLKKMPWGAALHIQAKLETWYRGLPTQLQPRWIVHPSHLLLQWVAFSHMRIIEANTSIVANIMLSW
jgi:hypothetical protein